MCDLENFALYANDDQVRFGGIFVPGGGQNMPTRHVFALFSYLVLAGRITATL